MADINLTVKIKDANVAKATERILRMYPNDEVDGNGDPKYATTKLWVEECCKRYLYEQVRLGHNMLQREAHEALENQDDYLG